MFFARKTVLRLGQQLSAIARLHPSSASRGYLSSLSRIQGKDLLEHVRELLPKVEHSGSHRSLADFGSNNDDRVLPAHVDEVVSNVKSHVLKGQDPDDFFPEVVISYATGGSPICQGPGKLLAAHVIQNLQDSGIPSYSDLFTHPARLWRDEYNARVNDEAGGKAKVVVVLLTEKYFESTFCLEEIQLAMDSNVTILPFRVEHVSYSEQNWWTDEWLARALAEEGLYVGKRQFETRHKELRLARENARNALKTAHIPNNSNMLDGKTALPELIARLRQELGTGVQNQKIRSSNDYDMLCELENRILRAVGQDVDHIVMRPSDSGGGSFVDVTIRIRNEFVNSPAESGLRNKLVDSQFDGSYMSVKHQHYTKGTMDWALNDFDKWTKCESSRVYSLVGDPGLGKTTITTRIAREREGDILARYFFRHGDAETDVKKMLCSIAYQISLKYPQYQNRLENHMQRGFKGMNATALCEFLLSYPMSYLETPPSSEIPRVVLLDALDECDQKEHALSCIQELQCDIPWLKFYITTRPEFQLGGDEPSVVIHQKILNTRQIEHIQDLRIYHENLLANGDLDLGVEDNMSKSQILGVLLELSDGAFMSANQLRELWIGRQQGRALLRWGS